jgi:hypothetical protein
MQINEKYCPCHVEIFFSRGLRRLSLCRLLFFFFSGQRSGRYGVEPNHGLCKGKAKRLELAKAVEIISPLGLSYLVRIFYQHIFPFGHFHAHIYYRPDNAPSVCEQDIKLRSKVGRADGGRA